MSEPFYGDRRAIFEFIKDHQGSDVNQIATSLKMDMKRVMDALDQLLESDLVKKQSFPFRCRGPKVVDPDGPRYFATIMEI